YTSSTLGAFALGERSGSNLHGIRRRTGMASDERDHKLPWVQVNLDLAIKINMHCWNGYQTSTSVTKAAFSVINSKRASGLLPIRRSTVSVVSPRSETTRT